MDLFDNNKTVRLKSHLDKYLVADDDQQTTRQSRNGQARRARWLVETGNNDFIRLKTYSGYYLTASNQHFLLGMTGKKVIQSKLQNKRDFNTLWKPIRDGFQVKLMAYDGTFLRANGGSPPWRNSITHDVPQAISSTNNWILWEAQPVEEEEEVSGGLASVSDDFSSFEDLGGSPFPMSPSSIPKSPRLVKNSAMEMFLKAKAVRLKSVVHNKYLTADEDQESVIQTRNASAKSARWVVELVAENKNIIRLRSCYNKYLTASNQPFLLGMTGRKVVQSIPPSRLDSSVEWEPVKEVGNNHITLKTRYGQLLRANGGLPPWRNSITHDIPHRTATQDWVVWDVHVLEINVAHPHFPAPVLPLLPNSASFTSESSSPSSTKSASFSGQEFGDSLGDPTPTLTLKVGDGRTIYYRIADEYGEVEEEGLKGGSITFKGNGVGELTKKLELETGLDDIVVCTRSPLNGKLYPLRLQLPPNNATMNVVVFQSSPKAMARAMPVISLPRNI